MPITAEDVAKYPFLPQAKKYLARLNIDVNELASYTEIREKAKQRIFLSLNPVPKIYKKTSKHYESEIVSYALALLYLSGISEKKLTQRFALLEAQKINLFLTNEKHVGVIIEIAKTFKWKIKDNTDGSYSIHFSKYLQNTSRGRLFQNKKWRLVNRSIENGWVHLNPTEMARLLQEEIRNRIEESVKQELVLPPPEIQKDIKEIKIEYQKRKPQFEKIHIEIHAKESEYPPCISSLVERATTGQHLSHVERFALVTYLLHQGIEIDSIVNLFSKVSDFKEDLTRYQIENLAGKKGAVIKPYMTYNCSTLQTHNVCVKPDDSVCHSIKNPLVYHMVKTKIFAKKENNSKVFNY